MLLSFLPLLPTPFGRFRYCAAILRANLDSRRWDGFYWKGGLGLVRIPGSDFLHDNSGGFSDFFDVAI